MIYFVKFRAVSRAWPHFPAAQFTEHTADPQCPHVREHRSWQALGCPHASCTLQSTLQFANVILQVIYRSTCVYDGGTRCFMFDQTCHFLWYAPSPWKCFMKYAMYLGQNCLTQRTLQFSL